MKHNYGASLIIIFIGIVFSVFSVIQGNLEVSNNLSLKNERQIDLLKNILKNNLNNKLNNTDFISSLIKSEFEIGNSHPLVLDEIDRYVENIKALEDMSDIIFFIDRKYSTESDDDLFYLAYDYYSEKGFSKEWINSKFLLSEKNLHPVIYCLKCKDKNIIGKDYDHYIKYGINKTQAWLSVDEFSPTLNIYNEIINNEGSFIGGMITKWSISDIFNEALKSYKTTSPLMRPHLGLDYEGVYIYSDFDGLSAVDMDFKDVFFLSIPFKVFVHPIHDSEYTFLSKGYLVISILILLMSFLLAYLFNKEQAYKKDLVVSVKLKTKKLEELNIRQESLFNTMPLGIAVSKSNSIININEKMTDITGLNQSDISNSDAMDVFNHKIGLSKENIDIIKRNEDYISIIYISDIISNNRKISLEVIISKVINGDIIYIISDISERKEKEDRLVLLMEAINHSNQSMMILNEKGNIIFANKSSRTMFPSSNNGIEYTIENDILDAGVIFNKGKTNCHWSGYFSINDSDKKHIYRSVSKISKEYNDECVFIVVDINETDKIEARNKEDHVQRLECIGLLAGGIAHDFNNLLTVIIGNSSLMRFKDKTLIDDSYKKLTSIEDAAKKAAQLCNQLLNYSGEGNLVIERIKMNKLIGDITDLLSASISKLITIELNLNCDNDILDIDESQIQQVVMNLIVNASESISKEGVIIVSTTIVNVEKGSLPCGKKVDSKLNPAVKDGDYFSLIVQDNGSGMNSKVMDKIFNPFFTTKFTGRGLGMSAVLGIIKGHDGIIDVESTEGVGTLFSVLLPIKSNKKCKEKDIPKDIPKDIVSKNTIKNKDNKLILVIDDEESIREFVEVALSDSGYKVITAIDGADGIMKYHQHKNDISCIMLDMTMPKMNGIDVLKEIRKDSDSALVILSSGYSQEDLTEQMQEVKVNGMLQKPYNTEDMLACIESIVS